jgi:hypothetical protein
MARSTRSSNRTEVVHGQPSWRLRASTVEACVTVQGGHLAPVTFDRKGRKIEPYSISPWAGQKVDAGLPPLLKVLRGDFFCMPFGGNETPYRGERYPPHGETANNKWTFEASQSGGGRHTLTLRMRTKTRPGLVRKRLTLVDGHDAVYDEHVISGMSGAMSFGHHATLRFPDEPESGRLSTSPLRFGMNAPWPTEMPDSRGYSILEPGYEFKSLGRTKMITGRFTDLTKYPARRGFEDIAILVNKPVKPFAWTAVTFPKQRYVWFAMKNPNVLRCTLMWMSNGGRHYAPWNGRHVNVMGLEELTSYFHYGLAESAKANPLRRRGVQTCVTMSPRRPLAVRYVMAVAPIPSGFDRVRTIRPGAKPETVTLTAYSGKSVTAAVDGSFVAGR